MRSRATALVVAAVIGFFLWHAGAVDAQIRLATGADEEVTPDGLHRVDPSIVGAAWVRPDLDLSRYTAIYVLPAAVQFRELPERRYSARSLETATEFPVSEVNQTRLREEFGEAFREEMSRLRSYEISDGVGRHVLLVRGVLTDVISGVPPDLPGSTLTTVRWLWDANIIMEVRDSMSDEVLARTAFRERVEGPFDIGVMTAVTPRVARSWSIVLRDHLEELSSVSR